MGIGDWGRRGLGGTWFLVGLDFEKAEAQGESEELGFELAESAFERDVDGEVGSVGFAGEGFDQAAGGGFTGPEGFFLRAIDAVMGGDMDGLGGGGDDADGEGEESAFHGPVFIDGAGALPVGAGSGFGGEALQTTG